MFKSRIKRLEERVAALEKASAPQQIQIKCSGVSIGEFIKIQRQAFGYSQEKLAEQVGIGRSMMAQIERGSKIPNMLLGKSIAQALECKMEWRQEQMLEEYRQYLHEKKMQDYAYQCERIAPHAIHGARIMQDGNQWCCILGDFPTGVVGFGDTPEKACAEFDRVWREGR